MHAALEDLVVTLGEEHRSTVKKWRDRWLMEAHGRHALDDIQIQHARDPDGLRDAVRRDVDLTLLKFVAADEHGVVSRSSEHRPEMMATMYRVSLLAVRTTPKETRPA